MSLEHAFDLWDWTTAGGLIVVGVVIGFVLLPYAWPDQRAVDREYPALIAGFLVVVMFATFFVFLIVFRLATHTPNAERAIGTAVEAIFFAVSVAVGLRIRSPRATTTTSMDDLAAQLAEIRVMAVAASQNAELAATAASAADDRVITQSERALDERKRTQTREEDRADALKITTDDTRERVVDIQHRVPKRSEGNG